MTRHRITRPTHLELFEDFDHRGRRSIEGIRPLLTDRRRRRLSRADREFFYRAHNGVHDPLTFFHLVDELTFVRPGDPFSADNLTTHLNRVKPQLFWDAVTVGRILNDLIESCRENNPHPRYTPLEVRRTWRGRFYAMTPHPEARALLIYLLDDLIVLGNEVLASYARGVRPDRLVSPLASCPTLTAALAAAV